MNGFLQCDVPSDQQMAPRHMAASARDSEANWETDVLGQILIIVKRKGKQNGYQRGSFWQIVSPSDHAFDHGNEEWPYVQLSV